MSIGSNETDDQDGDVAAKEHLALLKLRDRETIKAKKEHAQSRERIKDMREYKRKRDEQEDTQDDCGGMGET